jgi:hypothetical protein
LYQSLSSFWQKTQSLEKRACSEPFAFFHVDLREKLTPLPSADIATSLSR